MKGTAGIMTRNMVIAKRYIELHTMLEGRRRELMNNVQNRIRHVRFDGAKDRDVLDEGESSDVGMQEDVELALIEMSAETLAKIDEALRRLAEGAYGRCFDCGEEIAEARLRALPFAVRCKDCEQARETAGRREPLVELRRSPSAGFPDTFN